MRGRLAHLPSADLGTVSPGQTMVRLLKEEAACGALSQRYVLARGMAYTDLGVRPATMRPVLVASENETHSGGP